MKSLAAFVLASVGFLSTGFFSTLSYAKPHEPIDSIDALDTQIRVTLEYLGRGEIAQARLLARQIAWRFPDFSLGQLISAELESSSAFRDVLIAPHMPVERNVSELLLEAQRRLSMSTKAATPTDVIQLGSDLSDLVVVDLPGSTLYQYEVVNRQAVLIRRHYIGSGEAGFGKRYEGDLKTPLGVYSITSFLSDRALPDLYGSGALTLNYPNALDTYLNRTGYGIWLHGVLPTQLSRTPYSSEGCVTMSNEHLTRLANELDVSGTRVVLTNTPATATESPISRREREQLRQTFRTLFADYRQAWLDGNMAELTHLYSDTDELQNRLASRHQGLMRVSNQTADITHNDSTPYQQAFARIDAGDITILQHPDLSHQKLTQSRPIVLSAVFGARDEYRITIYWAQDEYGQWRVLTDFVESEAL